MKQGVVNESAFECYTGLPQEGATGRRDRQPHDPTQSQDGQPILQQEGHTGAKTATSATVYISGSGPGDQYKVCTSFSDPPFDDLRAMCARDIIDPNIDAAPEAFRPHRIREWPELVENKGGGPDASKYKRIYDAVKATGLPNCMGAKIPLDSGLNLEAWENYVDKGSDEVQLLAFARYGFPLGYLGPCSDTTSTPNHTSAVEFPEDVKKFVKGEVDKGALAGPFLAPPFTPWAHVSPLMSRPKSDGISRRIISDLTYPKQHSVNAYI